MSIESSLDAPVFVRDDTTTQHADARVAGRSALVMFGTAFLEGMSVIIVEIAGARALAPFFGTSLQVWTALITVTLFFLAVGYGFGGLLAKRLRNSTLPTLFGVAGIWLCMYPLLRTPILDFISNHVPVAPGSLISASLLFGVPLLMLGSVSPVLIQHIDRRRPGAGSAAGRLFFSNTMGGLAGGWLTAFLLIPHSSLRVSLVATGVLLLILALLWSMTSPRSLTAMLAIFLVAGTAVLLLHKPKRAQTDKFGRPYTLLYSQQSGIGLLQVFDFPHSRQLAINGALQGEMDPTGGIGADSYIWNSYLLAYAHHPKAKSALILGLGPGSLATLLHKQGVAVTVVELEPRVEMIARTWFGLPNEVKVVQSDARTFLRNDTGKYDLVFLDTYSGETTPWHLLTVEAMTDMKHLLNPGGRLLINTVAYAHKESVGLSKQESAINQAFGSGLLYPGVSWTASERAMINSTLVAGEHLKAVVAPPPPQDNAPGELMGQLVAGERPTITRYAPPTDERCDLDYADMALRISWRKHIWSRMYASSLGD